MRKKYDFMAAIKLCQYEYKWLKYRKNHREISERRALRAFCDKLNVPYKQTMFEVENSRRFLAFLYGMPDEVL